MPCDVMLHLKQPLDPEQRRSLLVGVRDRLGIVGDAHHSGKPHLLFVPVDARLAPPHAVLALVREQGYEATLVDL